MNKEDGNNFYDFCFNNWYCSDFSSKDFKGVQNLKNVKLPENPKEEDNNCKDTGLGYLLTKKFGSYAMAHIQPALKTKCSKIHGHNWNFTLTLKCPNLDKNGLLIDFKKLKIIDKWFRNIFDHKLCVPTDYLDPTQEIFLNKIACVNSLLKETSAEYIAKWVSDALNLLTNNFMFYDWAQDSLDNIQFSDFTKDDIDDLLNLKKEIKEREIIFTKVKIFEDEKNIVSYKSNLTYRLTND